MFHCTKKTIVSSRYHRSYGTEQRAVSMTINKVTQYLSKQTFQSCANSTFFYISFSEEGRRRGGGGGGAFT
jgi:hypothetical protein